MRDGGEGTGGEESRNIALKGLRLEGKELKERVEKVLKRIDANIETEDVSSVGKVVEKNTREKGVY